MILTVGMKFAKVVGRDQFGKEQKAMHVDAEMESYIQSMCRSDEYNSYAPHIRKGCNDILSSVGSRGIFTIFNNGTLGPETVVSRKPVRRADQRQDNPLTLTPTLTLTLAPTPTNPSS